MRGVVQMGETETVFANTEQRVKIKVRQRHGDWRKEAPDSEILTLPRTLPQMVTGGGGEVVELCRASSMRNLRVIPAGVHSPHATDQGPVSSSGTRNSRGHSTSR